LIEELQYDNQSIKEELFMCIFDLVIVFDLFNYKSTSKETVNLENLYVELSNRITACSDQAFLIIQGFSKLLLHRRVYSHQENSILCKLLLYKFSTNCEEGHDQFLSVFFVGFVDSRDSSKEVILEASLDFILFSICEKIGLEALDKRVQYIIYLLSIETSFDSVNSSYFMEKLVVYLGSICILLNLALEESWKLVLQYFPKIPSEVVQYILNELLKNFSHSLTLQKKMKMSIQLGHFSDELIAFLDSEKGKIAEKVLQYNLKMSKSNGFATKRCMKAKNNPSSKKKRYSLPSNVDNSSEIETGDSDDSDFCN
jgi:hypothetical protein